MHVNTPSQIIRHDFALHLRMHSFSNTQTKKGLTRGRKSYQRKERCLFSSLLYGNVELVPSVLLLLCLLQTNTYIDIHKLGFMSMFLVSWGIKIPEEDIKDLTQAHAHRGGRSMLSGSVNMG